MLWVLVQDTTTVRDEYHLHGPGLGDPIVWCSSRLGPLWREYDRPSQTTKQTQKQQQTKINVATTVVVGIFIVPAALLSFKMMVPYL